MINDTAIPLPYVAEDSLRPVRKFFRDVYRYINNIYLCVYTYFITTLFYNSEDGYVLKYPFVTNCDHKTYRALHKLNVDEVLTSLRNTNLIPSASERSKDERFPYVMLQPALENRYEYKIVLFNGKGTSM